jgi:DNA-binding CsgD family transcriptional regulator
LLPGRFEYDVVTTGRAVLARDVDVEAWRALAKLARLTGCRSYVAAPIVSGGAVVGILHGERSGSPRDVDELDRRMLLTFSKSVQLALGRAGLSAELHNVYADLKTATRTVDRAVARDRRLPELRVESDVVPAAAPGVAHGGAAQGIAARLPLDLTDRELEVLGLVATGMTNAVIARRLGIAVSTVKQHLKNILRKLEVGSRAEAVAYWYAGPVPST